MLFLIWAISAVFGDVDPVAQQICDAAIYRVPAMADVRQVDGAFTICTHVAQVAQAEGVDPVVAVAVAYHESRFRDLPSWRGQQLLAQGKVKSRSALPATIEQGPMQVKPRWHCPKGKVVGCDWTLAGVRLLRQLHGQHKDWRKALAYYKWPRRPSFAYSYRVWDRVRAIQLAQARSGASTRTTGSRR